MDPNKITIVLDTWEGQQDVDEDAFLVGGVSGLIPRINDTQGHLHKDEGFDEEWGEAENFTRACYFVYSPWETPLTNFEWLVANVPADCPAVLPDTELAKAGVTPQAFGVQYAQFTALVRSRWRSPIYTGEWFLPKLSPWPTGDYWWSAYPGVMYPAQRITITWDDLHARIKKLTWPPFNAKRCPGVIKLWQCSGDRLILPGTTRPVDISIFPGTPAEYRAWLGYDHPLPPPVTPPAPVYRVRWPLVNTRSGPGSNYLFRGYLTIGTIVHIKEFFTGWALIDDGRWIALSNLIEG